MSTRLNKHKICTKGSFILLNHVHSYMELPICGRMRGMVVGEGGRSSGDQL